MGYRKVYHSGGNISNLVSRALRSIQNLFKVKERAEEPLKATKLQFQNFLVGINKKTQNLVLQTTNFTQSSETLADLSSGI